MCSWYSLLLRWTSPQQIGGGAQIPLLSPEWHFNARICSVLYGRSRLLATHWREERMQTQATTQQATVCRAVAVWVATFIKQQQKSFALVKLPFAVASLRFWRANSAAFTKAHPERKARVGPRREPWVELTTQQQQRTRQCVGGSRCHVIRLLPVWVNHVQSADRAEKRKMGNLSGKTSGPPSVDGGGHSSAGNTLKLRPTTLVTRSQLTSSIRTSTLRASTRGDTNKQQPMPRDVNEIEKRFAKILVSLFLWQHDNFFACDVIQSSCCGICHSSLHPCENNKLCNNSKPVAM